MCGSEPGIDPYTRAVSDVYQDLFHEGSFIGKCIYDVDAFERVLTDVFPRTESLSHDLLEGCYMRQDCEYVMCVRGISVPLQRDVSRRHRWISRGLADLRDGCCRCTWFRYRCAPFKKIRSLDWPNGKIFDNLRRSLVPSALTLLLLLCLDNHAIGMV